MPFNVAQRSLITDDQNDNPGNEEKKKLLDKFSPHKFMHCCFFGILPSKQNTVFTPFY
jgi:Tfp pilus assembly protein PilP